MRRVPFPEEVARDEQAMSRNSPSALSSRGRRIGPRYARRLTVRAILGKSARGGRDPAVNDSGESCLCVLWTVLIVVVF